MDNILVFRILITFIHPNKVNKIMVIENIKNVSKTIKSISKLPRWNKKYAVELIKANQWIVDISLFQKI